MLDHCLAKTKHSEQKARAAILKKTFLYYKASILAYRSKIIAEKLASDGNLEAIQALQDARIRYAMIDTRIKYINEHRDDPLLGLDLSPGRHSYLLDDTWCDRLLWRLYPWVEKDEAIRERITAMALSDNIYEARAARRMLDAVEGNMVQITKNASFENGKIDRWMPWPGQVKVTLSLDRETALEGQACLRMDVKDAKVVPGLATIEKVEPGHYVALVHVYMPAEQQSPQLATMTAYFLSRAGQVLSSAALPPTKMQLRLQAGQWSTLAFGFEVPEEIRARKVEQVKLALEFADAKTGHIFYLDDVALYKLPSHQ